MTRRHRMRARRMRWSRQRVTEKMLRDVPSAADHMRADAEMLRAALAMEA